MTVNTGNLFSAVSLSTRMSKSLPQGQSNEIRNPYDALALLFHACMLAVGFRLVGLGEDDKIEASATEESPNPLPSNWSTLSPSTSSPTYAFRYAHDQSSLEYLLKISRLGSKAIINGLAVNDDKVHSLDLLIKDFFSESSFPINISESAVSSPTSTSISVETTDNQAASALRSGFISPGRMTDAGNLFKLQIIQKLAPRLHKEGYEESAQTAGESGRSAHQQEQGRSDRGRRPEDSPIHDPLRDDPLLPHPARPHPFHDPLAMEPPRRPPFPAGDFPPPGFEDEYEINRPRSGIGEGGRRPLNIGERDLYPQGLGPNDPLRGGIGPSLGVVGGGGGGMHPTFDDPMFAGGRGPGGGGGYDPQAPPGARYDPLGPGLPRGGPRGGGPGGGFGGRPPNPFGGFGSDDFI